jgi:hypothetical protein
VAPTKELSQPLGVNDPPFEPAQHLDRGATAIVSSAMGAVGGGIKGFDKGGVSLLHVG